jgi:1-aminocyclopropane-1-carboxylate deaminase/D-cysteine desulfhydrase-like pyridoxal-dependent ACC family enzyme
MEFFLKRDDLISLEFSGNKARKLFSFLNSDMKNIHTLISYGSTQSNAMYSLSVLAKIRGLRFVYYTTHFNAFLKNNPHGNYLEALKNGMELIVSEDKPLKSNFLEDEGILFIEEGGRDSYANNGLKILADEIVEWRDKNKLSNLSIFLPSGTGTTALFLQKNIKQHDIKVYTTPCVGDEFYLLEQFSMLSSDKKDYPTILKPPKKYHFAKLYRESYEIWLKLRNKTHIEFDMVYDPIGFLTLMQHKELFSKNLLYIHQGGLIGNVSMLERYKRKFDENIKHRR